MAGSTLVARWPGKAELVTPIGAGPAWPTNPPVQGKEHGPGRQSRLRAQSGSGPQHAIGVLAGSDERIRYRRLSSGFLGTCSAGESSPKKAIRSKGVGRTMPL